MFGIEDKWVALIGFFSNQKKKNEFSPSTKKP
jgi:hypothetical protein